jgi:hypothetical protein
MLHWGKEVVITLFSSEFFIFSIGTLSYNFAMKIYRKILPYKKTLVSMNENSEKHHAMFCLVRAFEKIQITQKGHALPLVYDMHTETVAKHLSKFVLYQDNAMLDVAKVINTAVKTRIEEYEEAPSDKPISMLLTGPPGLGKNFCIKVLKEMFRMKEEHPLAYIEYTQFSVLQEQLEAAISYYKSRPQEERDGLLQPHIILILFNEMDKAEEGLLNELMCLLSNGCLQNERGQMDQTPKSIRLIICFTANFGSHSILSNGFNKPFQHYNDLKVLVKNEMRDKGYSHCDISRLGTIIPFFPPNKEQLQILLAHKFYEILIVRRNRFTDIYGLVDFEDIDVYRFINAFIENNQHNVYSIKGMMNAFDFEISTLFSRTANQFSLEIDINNKLPLEEAPKLIYGSIPYCNDIQTVLGQNTYFMNAFKNLEYERRLAKRIDSQSSIQFLTIAHPLVEKVSISIIPLETNVVIGLDQDQKKVALANMRKRRAERYDNVMKRKMDSFNQAIDDVPPIKKGKYNHKDNASGDGGGGSSNVKGNVTTSNIVTNSGVPKKECSKCHLLLDEKKFKVSVKKKNKDNFVKEYKYLRSYCNSCRNQ